MKPHVKRQTSRYSRALTRNAKRLLQRWNRAGGAVRMIWEPDDKDQAWMNGRVNESCYGRLPSQMRPFLPLPHDRHTAGC